MKNGTNEKKNKQSQFTSNRYPHSYPYYYEFIYEPKNTTVLLCDELRPISFPVLVIFFSGMKCAFFSLLKFCCFFFIFFLLGMILYGFWLKNQFSIHFWLIAFDLAWRTVDWFIEWNWICISFNSITMLYSLSKSKLHLHLDHV